MITIITKPVSRIYDTLKFFQILLLKIQKKKIPNQKYGGHYAVTRSIVEGLEKIGENFNYNPKKISDYSETVLVLASTEALKQAIKLKKRGLIKKIITGPNILMVPSKKDKILDNKLIDIILQPSAWPKQIFTEIFPNSAHKLRAWPAGVDIKEWNIEKNRNIDRNILIYYKRPVKVMVDECTKILKRINYNVEILYYEKYSIDDYKEALKRNAYLIHFVEQESQGISLAEAWATNTPTLVWNPGFYFCSNGYNYYCSSAPYLSEKNGIFFRDIKEFEEIIKNKLTIENFSPKDWVKENMTDEVCAEKLIKVINS